MKPLSPQGHSCLDDKHQLLLKFLNNQSTASFGLVKNIFLNVAQFPNSANPNQKVKNKDGEEASRCGRGLPQCEARVEGDLLASEGT